MNTPVALTLILISYVLHTGIRHWQNRSSSTGIVNCRQFSGHHDSYLEGLFTSKWLYRKNTLNLANSLGHLYLSAGQCEPIGILIKQVCMQDPLMNKITTCVFGLEPEFKVVQTNKLQEGKLTQYNRDTRTLLLSPRLHPLPVKYHASRMHDNFVLSNVFVNIFIDLFKEHFGEQWFGRIIHERVHKEFMKLLDLIPKIIEKIESGHKTITSNEIVILDAVSKRTSKNDVNGLDDLYARLLIIQKALYKKEGNIDEMSTRIILTHLIQFLHEDLLKAFAPFFYNLITEMVSRFDGYKLQFQPDNFPPGVTDYSYIAEYAECFSFEKPLSKDVIKSLGHQVSEAIEDKDSASLTTIVSEFEKEGFKCQLNLLEKDHPTAFGRMHLVMARAYYFLKEHPAAHQHFRKAWHQKVDFTIEDVRQHYQAGLIVGNTEGSLRRAYNRTQADNEEKNPAFQRKPGY